MLVVCVGSATRLIEYVQRMPKRYVGTFLLGRQSATEDIEGDVTELPGAPVPTREQIEAAARRFVGRIEQRPPAFSALKIRGRPAYKLARQGKPVELQSAAGGNLPDRGQGVPSIPSWFWRSTAAAARTSARWAAIWPSRWARRP